MRDLPLTYTHLLYAHIVVDTIVGNNQVSGVLTMLALLFKNGKREDLLEFGKNRHSNLTITLPIFTCTFSVIVYFLALIIFHDKFRNIRGIIIIYIVPFIKLHQFFKS